MKRSSVNRAYRDAMAFFAQNHWILPPRPRWDITDFGLGDFERQGLTLVNLAAEPEYCEKLMYARQGQATPCHTHARKKEDLVCRTGKLSMRVWPTKPLSEAPLSTGFNVRIDGESVEVRSGEAFIISAGSRITLEPGVWHSFEPVDGECIIGEVSTANDDVADNFFTDPHVGRFPTLEEDEPAAVRLLRD